MPLESPGPLMRGVLGALTELDPYGLEPGRAAGAPADEYELEARPIVSLLVADGRITVGQFDAIWREWFGETLTDVIGTARIDKLVARLNAGAP